MQETPDIHEQTMSLEEVRKSLAVHAQAVKERYEGTQAAFLAAAQADPIHAITSLGEGMVQTQARHMVWLAIERKMVKYDPRDALAENIIECRGHAQALGGGDSASVLLNAAERLWAAALAQQADLLEDLINRI